jgi:hypothetical protein
VPGIRSGASLQVLRIYLRIESSVLARFVWLNCGDVCGNEEMDPIRSDLKLYGHLTNEEEGEIQGASQGYGKMCKMRVHSPFARDLLLFLNRTKAEGRSVYINPPSATLRSSPTLHLLSFLHITFITRSSTFVQVTAASLRVFISCHKTSSCVKL